MLTQLLILALSATAFARPRSFLEPIGMVGRDPVPEAAQDTISSDLCPALGHFLLPHEYDCTKFYYCEYGQKWVTPRDCALGTHFSFELQVCVHPVQAGCTLPGVPTEAPETEAPETEAPETEAPETEATTVAASSTIAGIASSPHTTSAPSSTEASIISSAHTTEAPETEAPETEATTVAASSTIAGIASSPHTTSAPSSTEASIISSPHTTEAPETEAPETEATTVAASSTIAGIASSPHTTSAPSSTEASIISSPHTTEAPETVATDAPTTASPGGEEDIEWLENGCPASWDIHWLLPHEECNKFYYCNFGELVERTCPANTYFNPTLQVCDWAENVDCASEETEATTVAASSTIAGIASSPHTTEATTVAASSTIAGIASSPHTTEATTVAASSTIAGIASSPHTTEAPETVATDAPTSSPGGEVTAPEGTEWLENGCPASWDLHWLLPHEECNKFYYCNFGELVERTCPENTYFNPTLQVCDWAENVDCASGETEATTVAASSTIAGIASSPHTTEATTVAASSTIAGIASSPHTTEATTVAASSTIAGIASSPHTTSAPSSTEASIISSPHTTEAVATDAPTTSSPEVTAPEGTEWLENGCPASWDIHWLLPHEECNQFYYCNFGELVERTCPANTYFNPALQVCDWAENVSCASGGNNEDSGEDGGDDSNVESSQEEEDNNTANESNETEWLDNGCPADWDVHWLLPHESDCGKFYYCVHGQKVERECREPLHFNPTLQVCDWAENAGCASSDNNSGEDNNNGGEGSGEDGDDNEDSNDGSGNGEEDTEENTEVESGEWLDNGCPADFDLHWLLPHESECGKFYYCVHGEKVERECREPLHFNPTLQVCDWAENAGCALNGNSEEDSNEDGSNGEEDGSNGGNGEEDGGNGEDGSNGGNGEDSGTSEEGDNNGGNGEDDTVIAPEEEPDNSKCESNCNILPWAHETACDKYWRCEGEKAVLVVCSEGLHFNANTGSCDFICNANCVRENVQSTADEQGLKIFVPWDKVRKGMRYY